MANKSKKQEKIAHYTKCLKKHSGETLTYQEIADITGINKPLIYSDKAIVKPILEEYDITLKRENTNNIEEQLQPEVPNQTFDNIKPLPIKEVEPEEIVWGISDKTGCKKMVYLKDMLWTVANGKKIPEGYEVVWKDGKPHALGTEGCTVSNLLLVPISNSF